MPNAVRRWFAPVSASRVSWVMLFCAIFNFSLFGITDVLMNFYYTSLGHSVETIGMLQSLPRIGGLLVSLPAGMIATRYGTRRVLIISMIGVVFSMFLPLVIPALPALALGGFLSGLFYGAHQVAFNPFLAAMVHSEHHPVLFSYQNVVAMVASASGSFVGGFLPMLAAQVLRLPPPLETAARSTTAYAAVLLCSCAVAFSSVWVLSRVPALPVVQAASRARVAYREVPWGRLVMIAIPMLFFGFTGGLTFPFYNLFFRETFHVSDDVVGTILSIGWLGMGFIPMLNPWLDRRFGSVMGLFIMMLIAAAAYFGLSLAPTLPLSIIAFIIGVSARGTMQPLYQPLVMANVPARVHNMASGMGFVMWNIGWFSATSISGFLHAARGYGLMMQAVSVAVLLMAVSIVLVFRQSSVVVHDPLSSESV